MFTEVKKDGNRHEQFEQEKRAVDVEKYPPTRSLTKSTHRLGPVV
jgi:hypothetical protein